MNTALSYELTCKVSGSTPITNAVTVTPRTDLAESEGLLDELWAFVSRPEVVLEHHWRVGDLVLWDNRCTMHRRDAFDASARRILLRTQVKGDARPT